MKIVGSQIPFYNVQSNDIKKNDAPLNQSKEVSIALAALKGMNGIGGG